jgi:Fe-Mn family superoxide dismutase
VTHLLPPLPYDVAALEPRIDARTMHLHHALHHAAYVRSLNEALKLAPQSVREMTADGLLLNLAKVPTEIRVSVRNNAGGHSNHSLFWQAMSPTGGGAPAGQLAEEIERAFDSFGKFKTRFEEAGTRLFGSGWVWLVATDHADDKLQLLTTCGHDSPLTQGYFPLLVNDVWEHAYYRQYENRRAEYLHCWWSLANWGQAARQLRRSRRVADPSADALRQVHETSAPVALHRLS